MSSAPPAPGARLATPRLPVPPFTPETAVVKVRAAEDAWNTRDPACVARAYTPDSRWRNRAEFLVGHDAIVAFLSRKWAREHDYRLIKELWAFGEARMALRLRMARRRGGVVAQPRERAVGVRRRRAHAAARGEHQRRRDRRG